MGLQSATPFVTLLSIILKHLVPAFKNNIIVGCQLRVNNRNRTDILSSEIVFPLNYVDIYKPLASTDKHIVWAPPDRSAYYLSFLTCKSIANLQSAGAFSRGVIKLWQSEFYAIIMAVFVPHGTAEPMRSVTFPLFSGFDLQSCSSSHSLKLCELTTRHSLGILITALPNVCNVQFFKATLFRIGVPTATRTLDKSKSRLLYQLSYRHITILGLNL